MSMVTLAAVQTDPVFGERAVNLERAVAAIGTTTNAIVVLPELFSTGYTFTHQDEVIALSEPFGDGPTTQALSAVAAERSLVIVFGFAERAHDAVFNSAGMVGPEGPMALYRKVHLFGRERLFFTPGDLPFPVVKTPLGRVGMMVCFDWYFPESMRTLALRGAHVVAHPSNLVLPNCPEGIRTRCLENRVFAVTANRVGSETRDGISHHFIGTSQITGTDGRVIARAPESGAAVITASVDLTTAENKTLASGNDLFRDRRPEFYDR